MKSFKHAFNGLGLVVRTQRNMRIHICFVFYVVMAGLVSELPAPEWAAVLICSGLVLALECINTALERLCDTLHPGKSEGIRKAKDASAAAVLCAALSSAAVGLLIFFQSERLETVRLFITDKPQLFGLIVLTLIPALVFVFRRRG
jgi:diacylglycerol kinase (ATP)